MTQQMKFPSNGETPLSDSPSRSVRLQLLDGTPHGLIVAEVINWTGLVLAAPRTKLPDLLRLPEAARAGIYILAGPDPDRPDGTTAYIGETDNVSERLRYHLRNDDKEFFERVAIVVAKDDNLTKAHARFLESQLIRLAMEVGVASLENGTKPDIRGLPEADRADMHSFVSQLHLVLPLLGFELFRQPTADNAEGEQTTFTMSASGATATARESEDGFVVMAGSTARKVGTETFPANWRALRDTLVQDGRLVEGPEPKLYRFAEDVTFSSPSAAAAVVAARSASGPREWKVKGSGQPYQDWRAAQLGSD